MFPQTILNPMKIQSYTQLFTTIQRSTQLFRTLQHCTHLLQTTLQYLTKPYKTLHNATKLEHILEKRLLHTFQHFTTLYKIFTKFYKLYNNLQIV